MKTNFFKGDKVYIKVDKGWSRPGDIGLITNKTNDSYFVCGTWFYEHEIGFFVSDTKLLGKKVRVLCTRGFINKGYKNFVLGVRELSDEKIVYLVGSTWFYEEELEVVIDDYKVGDRVKILVDRGRMQKGEVFNIEHITERINGLTFEINGWNFSEFEIELAKEEGKKYDAGKPSVGLLFESFPRALLEVATVCGFGAKKYDRGNWQYVDNANHRYRDAQGRHILQEYIGEKDEESQLLHLAHSAWNALCILELYLREHK